MQAAKERALPSLYFTNLISARPLVGPAGPGSLAQVINATLANRERFTEMEAFFSGVGQGDSAGIHEARRSTPAPLPVQPRAKVAS